MKKNSKFISGLFLSLSCVGPLSLSVSQLLNQRTEINIYKSEERIKQIEQFKNIDPSDIDDILDKIGDEQSISSTIFMSNISSADENLNSAKIISENKQEIKDLVLKIKSGDLLISEIQSKFDNYKNDNEEKFNEIMENYSLNSTNFNNKLIYERNSARNSFMNNISEAKLDNYNYEVTIDENNNTILEIDEKTLNFIKSLDSKIKKLEKFIDAQRNITIISSTLVVVAWGVAAFYWSAWWMWGANIPFALSATLQAGILTWFNVEAWKSIKELNELCSDMKMFKNSEELIELEKIMNEYGSINNVTNATSLIITVSMQSYWVKLLINKIFNYIEKLTFKLSPASKNLMDWVKNTGKQMKFLKSTSFANPISWIITAIDTALTLASTCTLTLLY